MRRSPAAGWERWGSRCCRLLTPLRVSGRHPPPRGSPHTGWPPPGALLPSPAGISATLPSPRPNGSGGGGGGMRSAGPPQRGAPHGGRCGSPTCSAVNSRTLRATWRRWGDPEGVALEPSRSTARGGGRGVPPASANIRRAPRRAAHHSRRQRPRSRSARKPMGASRGRTALRGGAPRTGTPGGTAPPLVASLGLRGGLRRVPSSPSSSSSFGLAA